MRMDRQDKWDPDTVGGYWCVWMRFYLVRHHI